MRRVGLALLLGVVLAVAALTAFLWREPEGSEVSWAVFTPADEVLPMSANLLRNTGFDGGTGGQADGWAPVGAGYSVDAQGGPTGGRAVRLMARLAPANTGASQPVQLNQSQPRPLHISGRSKADGVAGAPDNDYSLYVDLVYDDGTPLYAQTVSFDTGSHDWQYRERLIVPEKPVRSITVVALLRGPHTGAAWFADLSVRELTADVVMFDGVPVSPGSKDASPLRGAYDLSTGDGLRLTLAASGAVSSVSLGDTPVGPPAPDPTAGFLLRDVAAQSAFLHASGRVAAAGDGLLTQHSDIDQAGLSFDASYAAAADRIKIHAEVQDRTGTDRAVTLYFALPVPAEGWTWGDDIQSSRAVAGSSELANYGPRNDIGATGLQSRYPWAGLSGPPGGIALAVPVDSPRVFRLAYNPVARQFYAAFDLGLSPSTTRFPGKAWVDLAIYRFDPEWGFRAAAEGYYRRFPEAFVRRIPPEKEGIWVAFSDLAPIPNLADFGIGFHETHELAHVAFDEAAGIMSYRYLSEPWSHWLPIDDTRVDPSGYEPVMTYLRRQLQSGTEEQRRQAAATISSGSFGADARYQFEPTASPWCKGKGGCVLFTVNPDPEIADRDQPLTKAKLEWNDAARQAYTTAPGLDGEYLDSVESRASALDFRREHFVAADIPLVYRTTDLRLGIAEMFAVTKYARWVADDVHRMGKWVMANAARNHTPWGADAYDFAGAEVNWLAGGQFQPDSDAVMSYRRTLSYQRPYGLLMNTAFEKLTPNQVERYFQASLFYGIYPSMFSEDSASNPYWERPALYERDRGLFRRYIPLVRRVSAAGWEPVTYARASDAAVRVERFGRWPALYFTLRNTLDRPVNVTLAVDAGALGLPPLPIAATALLSGSTQMLSTSGPPRSTTVAVPAQGTEVLYLALPQGQR